MARSTIQPATHRHRTTSALTSVTLVLLMLGHNTGAYAGVQARLQRDNVQEGETVTLRIDSDGAHSNQRPDLSALQENFELLGTSTSSQTQIINGTRSDNTHWLVRLRPRHIGTLEIPAIRVGDEHTEPIAVKVSETSAQAKSEANEHLFLETSSSSAEKSIYVQQQIPYTARLFFDDSIQSGDLVGPSSPDAVVEQLGEEKRYRETRNGHTYNVIERNYAIAAEKSGSLHIAPARFHGTAMATGDHAGAADNSSNLFAQMLRNTPFANDPAFINRLGAGMAFGNTSEPVATHGQDMTLRIQPRPAAAHGNWLPAEQITLHDSWQDNRPQFKVGEPVTRTITIEAKGLAASQIPPLSLAQPAAARIYPEAPENQSRTDGKAIYGISKQTLSYIPNAQGTLEIAPIELAWWNTATDSQQNATLAAQVFQILPGAAPAPSSAQTATTEPASNTTAAVPEQHESWLDYMRHQGRRPAVMLGLLLAVMLCALAWARLRGGRPTATERRPPPEARPARQSTAMRTLRQACNSNDPHAAARALSDLAQIEWPGNAPRGLSALAARLATGAGEINALERHLYGAGTSGLWQGDALWHALSRGLQVRQNPLELAQDGLGALYQIQTSTEPDRGHSRLRTG